jgi:PAS domain S-box-containing protein
MDHIVYQQLLDLHKIGLFQVDNDNIIVSVNDAFCKLSDYKREFLIGKVSTDFLVREADIPIMDAEVERRLLGKSTTVKLWFVKADGNEYLSQASAVPYTLENGEVGGSYIIIQDVTKFNHDAWEVEQMYKNLPGMIFSANSNWETHYLINAKKICGYEDLDLLTNNVNWKDIIFEADRQRVLNKSLTVPDYPEHDAISYRILTKDGAIKWVTEHKTRHPNGEIAGMVYEDSGSAEKAKVFEDNIAGIFKASDKAFIEANHAFAELFGYEKCEIIDAPTDIIFFTSEERDACFMKCVEQQVLESYPIRLRKKDDSEVWVSLNAKLLPGMQLQGTMIDITSQVASEKLSEERRLTNQHIILRAQEEERLRISRDIHDSVGQMLIGIRLLFEEKISNMEPVMKAEFLEIDQYLDQTIKESRIIINKLGIALTGNNTLKSACTELLDKSKSFYKGKIHFSWTGNESLVSVNQAMHVFRIFQEVVTNVFKFAEATNLKVTVDNTKDFILIIKDDGIGYDQTMKTYGFGLQNIKERTKAIEGQITINSRLGKGTEVKLIISAK